MRQGGGGVVQVTIVAPSDRPGGVLGTIHRDGWLIERSADCFLASRPEAIAMVERLGLERELIGVEPDARRALIWHAGRAVPVPAGFRLMAPGRTIGILTSPLLSLGGRLRVLRERFVPARGESESDESLEHFAVRRLGREAFDRLVQPLAAGIWTADPQRLSMAAACPEFFAMERDAGSLTAGERARLTQQPASAAASGARYGQFATLASGMEQMPRVWAQELARCGVRFVKGTVRSLCRDEQGVWQLEGAGLDDEASRANAVVVATPASVASGILRATDSTLANELSSIDYAGSCVVSLGFPRDRVAHRLDAAGMVVPRIAARRILAVSFSSSKFRGRAPDGGVLLRVFLGGALDPEVMELSDAAMVECAVSEVEQLLGTRGEPRITHVERWSHAMPQYHVGHVERVAWIEAAVSRHPGLGLAGAAYTGVGIPQVIASGQGAALKAVRAVTP